METGLLLIFWYGVLHAFGPDHLAVIADFSIGRRLKRTMMITFAFALGHGAMLFLFAKMLTHMEVPDYLLVYGDLIASLAIIAIGLYLLYLVATDRIHLGHHSHDGEEHIHIWFGEAHRHDTKRDALSVFSIGALMGIGGVRGMLVTLGMLEAQSVDLGMVAMFVAGVTLVFALFGAAVLALNQNLLTTQRNVRRAFATAGGASLLVGFGMIFG